MHARPAGVLAGALRPFAARAEMVNESSGKTADARSVLSVVALDVAHGDSVLLRADGTDADEAIAAMRIVIDSGLGEAAGAAAEMAAKAEGDSVESRVPAGLRRLNVRAIAGHGISAGFAHGPVIVMPTLNATEDRSDASQVESIEAEQAKADRALNQVRDSIAARLDSAGTDLGRDLLRAHAGIAEDPAVRDKINEELDGGASAKAAVRRTAEFFKRTLAASASAYIRDRVIDVEDVCQQIIERLTGDGEASMIELREPSIVVADLLTPRQIMALDRELLRGLVLGRVGATSHTVILARAFGIPALVDVHVAEPAFRSGSHVIVDADGGFVLANISDEVRRYYAIEQRAAAKRRRRLEPYISKPAHTRCGARLEIGANVSTPHEVAHAMREGAEGIGLFRTEMLFLDRPAPPTEDEQLAAYIQASKNATGTSVIIRTLDIGGDKPAPYLRLPQEENPFLGWRGIRLYQRFVQILRTQLRAIVRASASGPVKIMAPMVSNVREAAWFVQRVHETQEELHTEGVAFDEAMPVGIMIEVPSAALAIEQLAKVVDFFSIGTNDLTQNFFAADRGNPQVSSLCDPLDPSFLRLLKTIVKGAQKHGKWIGVCGEMAGEARNLPIFAGLRVDEISVSPARVLELKAALASLDRKSCEKALNRAVSRRDAEEVRTLLAHMGRDGGGGGEAMNLIESNLVVIDSDAGSKVEAITELVEVIVSAGRASDAHAVENAVWAREDTYSTGVGFGFAIPHCKSDAVHAATIAVLRLQQPIDWGSTDGEPVALVIMLAIPGEGDAAAKAHMQVLAKLARKLMHDDFRERLTTAPDCEQLVSALMSGLNDDAQP